MPAQSELKTGQTDNSWLVFRPDSEPHINHSLFDTLSQTRYIKNMWCSKPYREAIELQQRIMVDSNNPESTGTALANLAKAYVGLEMLKLRLRMKPAPKAVDTTKLKKARASTVQPLE